MDQSPLTFATADEAAGPVRPLTVLTAAAFEDWAGTAPARHAAWAAANGFTGQAGRLLVLPDADGGVEAAVFGLGGAEDRARKRFMLAGARAGLPVGVWRLEGALAGEDLDEAALGFLLAGYRFDRYAAGAKPAAMARLVAPEGVDAATLEAVAAGEALTRRLIDTPANDMGPAELEHAARDLADAFGARVEVTHADDLQAANLPLIHAVGRAATAARAPRLIDLQWGEAGPSVTLVGKGVCFDTGGLNLKPGSSMGLMKKDMGGAAAVLGLARMLMATGAKLRLRVLIPAVENAVSGAAFRPGDILRARNGKTIEINNTDAEGRLVLADALALGAEGTPDLMVSMATLTGAARVAVGPDLAPFYCDDDARAEAIAAAGRAVRDPVWRMPFHAPYKPLIEPGIADLDNAPKGGFAGSITAALFLRRFAAGAGAYVHFDIYGWQPSDAPARPKGGAGQGARALFAALPHLAGTPS
ncbi:leucyl aminopeptidase family protein [Palleronia sediminis]|uniref:Leucyl aminopeptidase family protein n=1 Tax=Palleronia sediminis TaxID=2547833 RepID=A0A4R6A430_9RHOB|nr:leucyl aminopeptidase family protein [Palleronia sediminis]TDL78411.1 leucyl aminopeptidase family protein [Palleronia sediminis]